VRQFAGNWKICAVNGRLLMFSSWLVKYSFFDKNVTRKFSFPSGQPRQGELCFHSLCSRATLCRETNASNEEVTVFKGYTVVNIRNVWKGALLPNKCVSVAVAVTRSIFLCGVQRVKRFMNVRFHCNVSDLKRWSKTSTLSPGKITADACGHVSHKIISKNW